jgi:hypothetical protein
MQLHACTPCTLFVDVMLSNLQCEIADFNAARKSLQVYILWASLSSATRLTARVRLLHAGLPYWQVRLIVSGVARDHAGLHAAQQCLYVICYVHVMNCTAVTVCALLLYSIKHALL